MELSQIKTAAIIGAGTMGQGIAQVVAIAGYPTTLYDVNGEMLDKALGGIERNLDKGIERGKITAEQKDIALGNLKITESKAELVADFCLEAIIEDLGIKQKLFAHLEDINDPKTILATNTSSIPVTQIAAGLKHPERLVGVHFFNPAHIMKLVEIISGAATNADIVDVTREFVLKLKKTPVIAKDSPGFIVNRVARHFYVESLKIAEEGVADFETIDALIQSSGFKMGPFKLMDLIGIDTNFAVTKSMYNAFYQDAKFRPSRIQQQKVDAGHWGRKSGKGFYEY